LPGTAFGSPPAGYFFSKPGAPADKRKRGWTYGGTLPGAPADHFKYLSEFRRAFPDLLGTVDQFTFADGIGAAATTWSGTHSGELAGIPATGNKPIPPTGRNCRGWSTTFFASRAGRSSNSGRRGTRPIRTSNETHCHEGNSNSGVLPIR
jgi:hypothetical protein